ncbi:MAG: hypothetical protein LAN64_17925 [Acidobacteriia bacterium]|nr:hypothetical protein [Terriglobia bacterium]
MTNASAMTLVLLLFLALFLAAAVVILGGGRWLEHTRLAGRHTDEVSHRRRAA